MEQKAGYDEFVFEGDFFGLANNGEASDNETAQLRPNPAYHCPSDPNARPDEPNTNYMGVQGGGSEADAECRTGTASNYRLRFNNGVMFQNSGVKIAHILDGTTNTFLTGETRWWFSAGENIGYGTYFTWASANRTDGSSSHVITVAAAVEPINNPLADYNPSRAYPDQGGPTLLLGTHTKCFGSHHPGGCHFTMADGSVHFLSENMDLAAHRQLGQREDGLPIGGFSH